MTILRLRMSQHGSNISGIVTHSAIYIYLLCDENLWTCQKSIQFQIGDGVCWGPKLIEFCLLYDDESARLIIIFKTIHYLHVK